jgi:hypothetical protein
VKTFTMEHARAFRCKPLFAVMPEQIWRPIQTLIDEYPGLVARYGTGPDADKQVAKELGELVKASDAAFNLYFGTDGTTMSIQG